MRVGNGILKRLDEVNQAKFKDFIETIENAGYKLSAFKKVRTTSKGGKLVSVYQTFISDEDDIEIYITNDKQLYAIGFNEVILVEPHQIKSANLKTEAKDLIKMFKLKEKRMFVENKQLEKKASKIHEKDKSELEKELEQLQAQRDELKKEIENLKSQLGENNE